MHLSLKLLSNFKASPNIYKKDFIQFLETVPLLINLKIYLVFDFAFNITLLFLTKHKIEINLNQSLLSHIFMPKILC